MDPGRVVALSQTFPLKFAKNVSSFFRKVFISSELYLSQANRVLDTTGEEILKMVMRF